MTMPTDEVKKDQWVSSAVKAITHIVQQYPDADTIAALSELSNKDNFGRQNQEIQDAICDATVNVPESFLTTAIQVVLYRKLEVYSQFLQLNYGN